MTKPVLRGEIVGSKTARLEETRKRYTMPQEERDALKDDIQRALDALAGGEGKFELFALRSEHINPRDGSGAPKDAFITIRGDKDALRNAFASLKDDKPVKVVLTEIDKPTGGTYDKHMRLINAHHGGSGLVGILEEVNRVLAKKDFQPVAIPESLRQAEMTSREPAR